MFLENYQGIAVKWSITRNLGGADCRDIGYCFFPVYQSPVPHQKYLEEASISYLYLDGTVKSAERLELVDSFNSGEGDVFSHLLKAGGLVLI